MNVFTQVINCYVAEIDKIYHAGNATEHSYRPALKNLLEAITSGLTIINEPRHIACGAPDYIITRDGIPVGYIEAKDISVGLDNKANNEQFNRYKQSLGNLIITDYLTFRLFTEGNQIVSVSIARESGENITPDKKQYDVFLEMINRFTYYSGKTIYLSLELARMMAAKAKLLADVIKAALSNKTEEGDTLSGQLEGFRKILIHNLSEAGFADMYAQTLAYGLFAARLNQVDNQTFNRMTAAHLVPKSNPFLRKFFQYIAGFDLDSRIRWIVDALADLFNCVAIEDILKEFGRANQDPYIHFYETFLAEYDPTLRESRGVYYTPLPVVRFIVKAVDDILQKEFGLTQGLADNSKIKLPVYGKGKQDNLVTAGEKEFHKVQILDPAAGTGTFLSEVVNVIYSRFAGQKGMWEGYCEDHLIPRLNGFEILMASYAMAHFKLDMTFKETGFYWNNGQNGENKRLHIYLTNTLEEAPEQIPELFMAQWLAREAEEARNVKRDVPVMVVMGNPPYNVSTQNKNGWIDGLITEYKQGLNEKKLNLDDDYIKFIRYGQYLIEKTTNGILAYISNNSFITGITHREMRKTLLKCFDRIYIFDLHGSAKKKETTPDGGKDENVFNIQQGVSINIFIKTANNVKPVKVFHCDLFGNREEKYRFLLEQEFSSLEWRELAPKPPYYFFVPKNFDNQNEYEKGFSVTELFTVHNNAIKTDRDALFIDMEREILEKRIQKLLTGKYDEKFIKNYNVNDSGSYKLTSIIKNKKYDPNSVMPIQYRPFDYRFIYYQQGITSRSAYSVMKHFISNVNTGLVCSRQYGGGRFFICFIVDKLLEISSQPYAPYTVFPLYLYPDKDALDKTEKRRPNLNAEIINKIAEKINLSFIEEKTDDSGTFAPNDILDYIYAVLYSPAYRVQYREFLKIDFPRVPYPANTEKFKSLIELGAILRCLHLLEGVTPSKEFARYPVEGRNTVDSLEYKDKKVWINKQQYFETVPPEAWNFYISGYQPAQKWLKDRKGRTLNFDDIQHYQKIINVLYMTGDIQKKIDEVIN
jgi:predicted helicase